MKIAVNTRFLLPNKLEGIGWFTHEVLKRWVEWHPEHEFIFIFDRPFSQDFIFAKNVTGVQISPPARHPILWYLWFEWSIPRLLKKLTPDVFVSTDGYLSLKTEVPTLMVLHDIGWKYFQKHVSFSVAKYYEYFVPKFSNKATRLATVSEYSKQDIVNTFGIDDDKIDVVYNGSHTDYFPISTVEQDVIRKKYTENQPYFLYVGSIHPRKNIPNLLRAFEQFKLNTNSQIKLVLAGRMAWKSGEVGNTLSNLKHKNDIIFLGYVDNDLLPKLVASAFALTYISLFEGFGIPVLEAMCCDVPSITSNCSSMPEVAGNAGLLADPRSIKDICHQMTRMWSEPKLRSDLIDKGKIQRQYFSWDQTAKKMWDCLQKTIIGHS